MAVTPSQMLAEDELDRRFSGISYLVGNTPLLAIDCSYDGEPRTVYAKAENLNLTGSIKDRMALHILRRAYERGALRPGGTDHRSHLGQYRHRLRRSRQGARPPCDHLHAGLDEPRAHRPHRQLRRRHRRW